MNNTHHTVIVVVVGGGVIFRTLFSGVLDFRVFEWKIAGKFRELEENSLKGKIVKNRSVSTRLAMFSIKTINELGV